MTDRSASPDTPQVSGDIAALVDEWSSHLWHTSQHNRMVIGLGGRIQDIANEMRRSVGLPEFGWDDAFPDERFRECSVHVFGCDGQETHSTGSDLRAGDKEGPR